MRRIFLLLLLCSSIAFQRAYAQPTFTFSPQQIMANQDELVCLDVTVEDFTDIIGVRFSINWDAGVLTYQSITNINPGVTGLDISDFGTSQSGMGILTLDWSNGQPCATATSGVTLPDNVVLFSVCFFATGICGNHAPIEITDDPLERYVTRLNANCNDIGEFINAGFVSVCTSPLTINISSADGFTGDIVCLDFNVEDFDNILAFQFSINWDSSVLEFLSANPMNLPFFTNASIGTAQAGSGILTALWFPFDNQSQSLADGTQILQVCFKVIGACGQNSSVYISGTPSPVEVINQITGSAGTDIGLLQQEGNVTVNCFNPNGITLNVDDKNICPGESFTVDVRVSNYSNITKLQFNLQWNNSVIQLENPKVSYPQSGGCFSFPISVNVTTPGLVKVNWTSLGPSCSLSNNFILMRLHFKAVGPSGSNSNIAIVNPIYVEQFGPPVENIGINNNNGFVSICQLTGPTIVASSAEANPSDTVCISFSVQDFDEITSMLYSVSWEPNVLQYLGVQGFNLAGLDAANFYEAQAQTLGVLGVEWANGAGTTVPDGTSIFTLCFKLLGDPGDCTSVWFSDIPYFINIETALSNGTNVGLNGQPGQVCTLNPLSFVTSLPEIITGTNSQVCLDMTVENFNQLTNMQYSINWNPAILQFDTILPTGNLPNFTTASYDDNILLTSNGQLIIDWSASNQVLGASVPDGASIFQLCFNVMGGSGDCSAVSISDSPAVIEITTATTGESNLGMTAGQGSVCVSASLALPDYQITGVECPSDPTGAIDITVSGGSGNYLYQWSGAGVVPTAEDQTGLSVGNYFVTITDAQNPGLFLKDIFTVEYTANVTIADAGPDTTFACGNFFLTLNGSGSSSGPDITYLWQGVSGGGLVLPGEGNKMNPVIIGGSCYQLTVTNASTGCVATDIVCIAAPQIPFVNANSGALPLLTCSADTVELDGTLSSFGFDVQWTAGTGGNIVPGTEHYLTPLVTTPAMYYLTLSVSATGCSATDSVFVDADTVLPIAFAGADTAIGCNDPSVPVSGMGSSIGLDIKYDWSAIAMGAGEICGDTTSLSTTICAPGTYQLVVTDTGNGCTAVDFVEVMGDTLKPSIDAGINKTITCAIDAVQLGGVVISGSGSYSYNWSFTPGGNILSGQGTLTPMVNAAATYTLQVTDNANGCQAFSEVAVNENKTPPAVIAAADGPISCTDAEAVLDGTGSSVGLGFAQQWFDENGMLLAGTLTATVTAPGTYKFMVTNNSNGCQDSVLVEVQDWTTPPVANAGDDQSKTCVLTEVTLQGTIDTSNPNLVIQWSGPFLNCIQNANSATPKVTCTGQYIMTVLDTLTGCLHKDTVIVMDDTQPPPANAGNDSTLTCAVETLVLNGSSQPNNVTAAWTSITGGLNIVNPNSFTPTISQPGTFILTVTSNINGCKKTDLVIIAQDTISPDANAGGDDFTDCLDTLGNLSAAQSTLTGTSLTWSAITGSIDAGDIHNVDITVGPGQYLLTVVSDINGCEATDTAEVVSNAQLPTVNAGADASFGCTDTLVTLTGTGSTGGQLTSTWTDANTMIIGSGLTVDVTAPGVYTLTIFDGSNNCVNTDKVEVVAVADGEPANAGTDGDPCSDEAMLLGNLPVGATGLWTTTSGAIIEFDTAATTLATGLTPGDNYFTWTLSIGHCEDYSSDTSFVQVDQSVPSAFADLVNLGPLANDTISLNLLANDHFGSKGVDLSILSSSVFGGTLIPAGGDMLFARERCFAGTIDFDYEICSVGCPELCDTASAKIVVEANDSDVGCDEVPNGITPNGDGLNDELVFDVLLNNPPSEFPDNEIIIFNRWGDIVFQAKPYLNDWKGTNDSGKDLPQATYYYILRLNIANGDIIRGDVTILK